ncbi:MAG: formylglycine-generating enzyme family protein [Cytophagaceae bacterium]|jgi:formylglycine-generating enzyme required for sulfatase activity|nr:formylglycine-generating enzyme family protein [Cytophagaceae bacterium]
MKIIRLLAAFLLIGFSKITLLSNNVSITNSTVTGADHIQFDISWDNSWFITGYNYDAVWIFLKTQNCAGSTTWDHLDVSTVATDHTVSGGTGLTVEASTDGKGVFIRRNTPGFGTQTGTITLRFAASQPAFATVNFHVFGIEMVWVAQGTFTVGDGSTNNTTHSAASFGSSSSTPRSITSEAATVQDFFRNDKAGDGAITAHNGLPGAFPKGFNGFYCMKYEISQQQYVAFLNRLNLIQQSNRIAAIPTDPVGTLALTTAANQNRNAIRIQTSAAGTSPAVFGTDLNGDGTFGDGDNIACNFLSWNDLVAYLDWAALRPMSELEFEKACRGPMTSLLNEYPWGNTSILQAVSSSLNNGGTSSEVSTLSGNGLCAFNGGTSAVLGPLRTGFAATSSTIRVTAGASYWGIVDLGGNVWEQTVSCGYWNGSARLPATYIFNGANGDGNLDFMGNSNVATWPSPLTSGSTIVRGGNWEYGATRAQLSDRFYVNNITEHSNRVRRTGGRGVRIP